MVLMIAMAQQKINSINFSKAKTKFCLSLHCNGDESYMYIKKTEICKFKVNGNISWHNFCLLNLLEDLTKDDQIEISLNGTVS